MPARRKMQMHQDEPNFFLKMGAISSVLDAILRRINFSTSFFRSFHFSGLDAKFGRESVAGENFGPIGAQCATCAGNFRQFCVKVWCAGSDAISVRTLTPEICPRTSVLYPRRWLAVFFAFCCIGLCKGDLLSRFVPRVFSFL